MHCKDDVQHQASLLFNFVTKEERTIIKTQTRTRLGGLRSVFLVCDRQDYLFTQICSSLLPGAKMRLHFQSSSWWATWRSSYQCILSKTAAPASPTHDKISGLDSALLPLPWPERSKSVTPGPRAEDSKNTGSLGLPDTREGLSCLSALSIHFSLSHEREIKIYILNSALFRRMLIKEAYYPLTDLGSESDAR